MIAARGSAIPQFSIFNSPHRSPHRLAYVFVA
jgi:hypothetical protein